MSYILAATDFSSISINAVQYAAGLAQQQQIQLVLLHAFAFPAMINDVTIPASLIDDTRNDAEKNMQTLTERLTATHPGLNIRTMISYGTFMDAADECANEWGAPWLLAMGNSNTQENTSWFFSTLKDASRNMPYSILAVPLTTTYTDIKKICYADDIEQEENAHVLNILKDVTLRTGAELHVLNVQQDASLHDDSYEVGETTRDILADTHPQYHYRHLANVDESIKEFCINEQVDLLAMMPGKYSFLEGLFHKSHTKALAETLKIPLLILH